MIASRKHARSSGIAARPFLAILVDCYQERCRRYRKALKRCRKSFTHESVHQLRVETRRLLAFLSLVEMVPSAPCPGDMERILKRLFKTSAQLRDAQVQRLFLDQQPVSGPEVTAYREYLVRTEKKLKRRLNRKLQDCPTSRLRESMGALRKVLWRSMKGPMSGNGCAEVFLRGIGRAFQRAVRLHRQVRSPTPASIHRLRLAFKKFRYLVESLQPMLPVMPRQNLAHMHTFQTRLGEIQDTEVLRRDLRQFFRKNGLSESRLQEALERRLRRLLGSFRASADRLYDFWPPSNQGLPPHGKGRP